jgi:hypothetical protein
MYALTLKQPWAFAVAELGKNIENRKWPAPPKIVGQRIAIHAGLSWDREGMIRMGCIGRELGHGDKIPGWYEKDYVKGKIVAVATLAEVVTSHPSLWFGGPYSFVLTDVRKVSEPCSAKGYQRFWKLPPELEEMVLSRVA